MQEEYKFFKLTHQERKNPVKYEISNFGNIKRNGIIIYPNTNIKGYIGVAGEYLHRAVAQLFIPNPENKPEVDHIDGNRFNNHYTNLRWVTHQENLNNPIARKRNSKSKIQQYKDHPELKEQLSEAHKGLSPWNKCKQGIFHHTEESKQKISQNNAYAMLGEKLKDHMTEEAYNNWKNKLKSHTPWNKGLHTNCGEKNPMYGKNLRRWVNKNGIRHLIKKEELDNYINSGWKLGQK